MGLDYRVCPGNSMVLHEPAEQLRVWTLGPDAAWEALAPMA